MNTSETEYPVSSLELPTLGLIIISYATWIFLAVYADAFNGFLWIILGALNVTLFMSITHEVLHGHPTRNALINRLLILLPIAWSLPYERFRDTHLAHHTTSELTDPFDDPESWYVTNAHWLSRTSFIRAIFIFNNTLFGRMLIGPIIALGAFYRQEVRSILVSRRQSKYLIRVWSLHILLCVMMGMFLYANSTASGWQWLMSVYIGHSVLFVRTYLEHQAAPDQSERTVIIEKSCPIAFLFLFNNYHFIHHDKPGIPWYRLPAEFEGNKGDYLARNGNYVYRSYAEVFKKYFFTAKEPVPHPFLRSDI